MPEEPVVITGGNSGSVTVELGNEFNSTGQNQYSGNATLSRVLVNGDEVAKLTPTDKVTVEFE